MHTNLIASAVIAALLLAGTATAVSLEPGQGAQLPQLAATEPNTAAQPTVPAATAPAMLTREEALSIALAHAGVTAEEITGLHMEDDTLDRLPHWDLEWRVGDWEYDYDVHAQTGAVLEASKEYDPPKTPPTPAQTEPAPAPAEAPVATEPAQTAPKYLTAQEVLAIALKHAQLAEGEITRPETEFDWDDGVPVYDVEFRCGGWEYDYEIHAETGAILEHDKDWDD